MCRTLIKHLTHTILWMCGINLTHFVCFFLVFSKSQPVVSSYYKTSSLVQRMAMVSSLHLEELCELDPSSLANAIPGQENEFEKS